MKKKSLAPPAFWTITFLLGTLLYAIVRYITFGNYGIHDIPLFILNKSVSWSSVLLLFFAILKKSEDRQSYFRYVRLLLTIHTGISLLLISPEVYPKFFEGSSFGMYGGLAMLTGILCFTAFFYSILVPTGKPGSLPLPSQLIVTALVLLLFHTAFIGLPGWLTPEKWNGGMPPITLLAFLTGLIVLALSIRKRSTQQ